MLQGKSLDCTKDVARPYTPTTLNAQKVSKLDIHIKLCHQFEIALLQYMLRNFTIIDASTAISLCNLHASYCMKLKLAVTVKECY
jgi:hypothetical protein